jgi:hypothetical protein
LHVDYRKSRIKQCHKEGEALRTETTINDTRDFEAAFQDMQKPVVIADQRAVALRFADPRVQGLLHILLLFSSCRAHSGTPGPSENFAFPPLERHPRHMWLMPMQSR